MSTYLEQAAEVKDAGRGTVLLPAGLADEFPSVAEVFRGSFNEETGFWNIPPGSLTLFIEGRRLKFVISPRGFHSVCFGTVADASKGLAGVCKAIAEGQCEWKPRGGHKRS